MPVEFSRPIASMEGGLINPPKGVVGVGGMTDRIASMEGGLINPPKLHFLVPPSGVVASFNGGGINQSPEVIESRTPVTWAAVLQWRGD